MIAETGMITGIVFLCAVATLNIGMVAASDTRIIALLLLGMGCVLLIIRRTRVTGRAVMAVGIGLLIAAVAVLREQSAPGDVLPEHWLLPFALARDAVEARITQMLPEPHAALLTGLLTGARTSMPPEFVDDLRTAGIIHIVAISGYNITLVLTMTDRVLRWIPRMTRRVLQVVSIAAFTLFVGADPPVVRAAIMGSLGVAAIEGGRIPQIRRGMLWAAVIMLLLHPSQLTDDAGFQLSFLSLMGIVELSPYLLRFDGWIPDTLSLRESTRTTIAAQCGTMPLIACIFGSIPLLAVPANVLVAPLVPLAMMFGSVALAVHVVWPAAGQVIAFAAWAVLEGIVQIASIVGGIPYAAVNVQLPVLAGIFCYAAGGVVLLWVKNKPTTGTRRLSSDAADRQPAAAPEFYRETGNYD